MDKPTLSVLVREQRHPFIRRGKFGTRRSIGLEARFAQKYVVEPNGCWRWIGSGGRYGQLMISHRSYYAHILAYHLFVGDVPKGLNVCHSCDTPLCVNCQHLFLGTQTDNMRDAAKKGRTTIGERNPQAKLTRPQVDVIRALLGKHLSHAEIASQFNVSRPAITYIANNKTWRTTQHGP